MSLDGKCHICGECLEDPEMRLVLEFEPVDGEAAASKITCFKCAGVGENEVKKLKQLTKKVSEHLAAPGLSPS